MLASIIFFFALLIDLIMITFIVSRDATPKGMTMGDTFIVIDCALLIIFFYLLHSK